MSEPMSAELRDGSSAAHAGMVDEADVALAGRSVPAAVSYPIVLLLVLWATSTLTSHPAASLAAMAWMSSAGLLRLAVTRALPRVASADRDLWRLAFRAAVHLSGLSWGTGAAYWLVTHGLDASTVIVMVVLAGTSAGAVNSLSPSISMLRAQLVCMLGPSVIALLLFHPSRLSLGFSILLAVYFGFLSAEGRQAHGAFQLSLRRTHLLQRRATELAHRGRRMRLVLDTIDQGLLEVSLDGTMSTERSAVFERWLGECAPGKKKIWDYLAPVDGKTAGWIELGWESLGDGFLPIEVALDQLPRRLVTPSAILAIEYRPLIERGQLKSVLFIATDVSKQLSSERSEADKREMATVFEQLLRDRSGAQDFLNEGDDLLWSLESGTERSPAAVRRLLHTLKGNCSTFGLMRLASLCHDLETYMLETGGPLAPEQIETVCDAWDSSMGPVKRLIGEVQDRVDLSKAEHAALLRSVARGANNGEILGTLESWLSEPTSVRLERIGQHIASLASRLGKGPVIIEQESTGIRLPNEAWRGFWSAFGHVVRNAIVHGIETPDERVRSGKPVARIALATRLEGDELVISLEDDGAGINWSRVETLAKNRGLAHETPDDLEAALFADGLSTQDAVTEDAGRGVGMSAFLHATEDLGGRVELWTARGQGTRWTARFPRSAHASVAPRRDEGAGLSLTPWPAPINKPVLPN